MVPALILPGQRTKGGGTERAFPVGDLLTAEGCHGTIGPGVHVRAIVGAVDDDGVVGDAEFVDLLQNFADVFVMIDHRIVVGRLPPSGLADALLLGVGPQVHVGEVDPHE